MATKSTVKDSVSQKETTKKETVATEEKIEKNIAEAAESKSEPEYSAEEYISNAEVIFSVKKECVVAALKVAGVSSCTPSKAKEIVEGFMKKEVK